MHALVFGDVEATVRTLLQCRSAGRCGQCSMLWCHGLLLSKRPRISKRKVPVIRDACGLIKNRTAVEQVERGVHCLLGAIVAWGYGALRLWRLICMQAWRVGQAWRVLVWGIGQSQAAQVLSPCCCSRSQKNEAEVEQLQLINSSKFNQIRNAQITRSAPPIGSIPTPPYSAVLQL